MKAPPHRAADMVVLFQCGHTLQEIGNRYGITRERVRQILAKKGLSRDYGGAYVRAIRNMHSRQDAVNARAWARYGCTLAESRKFSPKVRLAYYYQRKNAENRGIAWKFSLASWWAVWQKSGKWEQRGRRLGCYGMCRLGDRGAYGPTNVYIATCTDNISDYYALKHLRIQHHLDG